MATPYVGGPIIVQGQPVQGKTGLVQASAYGNQSDNGFGSQQFSTNSNSNSSYTNAGGGWSKGERQPNRCQDGFWAVLFVLHLIGVAFAAFTYAPLMAAEVADAASNYDYNGNQRRALLAAQRIASSSEQRRWLEDAAAAENGQNWNDQYENYVNNNNNNGNDNNNEADWSNVEDFEINSGNLILILVVSGIGGLLMCSFALGVMMKSAEGLIKIALWFNIITTGLVCLVGLVVGALDLAIVGFIGVLFAAWYAWSLWHRIPFAASNLVTAATAVKSNIGLTAYAYWSLVLGFLWSIGWGVAAVATVYVVSECDEDGVCDEQTSTILMILFVLSYYWTAQVIKNVVHVTTAGTVGTWWFTPLEASTCCSRAVRDSYWRSMTTSFGSICLGSLIVAIIQTIKEIVHSMREEGGGSILLCCLEFIIGCIERLVEYFNQWAFVYVGLYGYSFMEAGRNVMTLFRNRGWTAIIADVLVDTVLFMVSIGVALLSGLVSLLAASVGQMEPIYMGIAFFVGFVTGFVMSTTLFSIVSSAVNTVVVCYAEAPAEFQANHPILAEQMQTAWRQAYPTSFNY